jgi:hypothetical protein
MDISVADIYVKEESAFCKTKNPDVKARASVSAAILPLQPSKQLRLPEVKAATFTHLVACAGRA